MDISSLILRFSSFFGNIVSKKVSDAIIGRAKRKKISSLIEDYKGKSLGVHTSCVCLTELLSNNHLTEEFIAHCYRPIKSKDEIISLFLYGNDIPKSHDELAEKFVGDLFDEITLILEEDNYVAVHASVEIQKHEHLEQERHEEILRAIQGQYSNNPDYLSISLLIEGVEANQRSLNDLVNILNSGNCEKKAKSYLEYYIAFCYGEEPVVDSMVINDLPSSLVSSLAAVAFSSGKHYAAAEILSFAGDADDFAFAVRQVSRGAKSLGRISEEGVPANSPYAPFVMILNAEMCVLAGAYPMAEQHYLLCDNALNPVARVHQTLARLSKTVLYCPSAVDIDFLGQFISLFPLWASEVEKIKFGGMLDFAMNLLSIDNQKALVEQMPSDVRRYLPDAQLRLRLAVCNDIAEVKEICEDAAKRNRLELFCLSAEKLISMDFSLRQWVNRLMKTSGILKNGGIVAFLFFVRQVDETVPFEDFCALGEGLTENPRFHLELYARYKDKFPKEANEHIEIALNLMKISGTLPCYDYASEWVSYLVNCGRSSDVIDILTPYMEVMTEQALRAYLNSAGIMKNTSDLASRILLGVEKSGNPDPSVKCLIAWYYCAVEENWLKASRLALESFYSRKTEFSAALAMESLLRLSMDIPSELENYAKATESSQLAILLSEYYYQKSQPMQADGILVRAALRDESFAKRILAIYFTHHIEEKDNTNPESVEAGTCVTLTSDDEVLSLMIHEDATVVPCEGCNAFGLLHYTSSSPAYYSLRGLNVGGHARYDNKEWIVEKIEYESTALQRIGFEQIVSDPRTVAFTSDNGNPEAAINQIAEYLKGHQPKKDFYTEGIECDNGSRLYLGVESGHLIFNACPLEFILTVVFGEDIPFRRVEIGMSSPVGEGKRFLLSYNSVVLLSLFCHESEEALAVLDFCYVTNATKNRIEQDIHTLSNKIEGSGALVLIDDEPMLLEYENDTRKQLSTMCAQVATFVANLQVIQVNANDELPTNIKLLDQNTIADMETAKEENMFFVTEDCLQANFIDCFPSTPKRCSLYTLVIACGKGELALKELQACMINWGATPHMDLNIANVVQKFIADLVGFE